MKLNFSNKELNERMTERNIPANTRRSIIGMLFNNGNGQSDAISYLVKNNLVVIDDYHKCSCGACDTEPMVSLVHPLSRDDSSTKFYSLVGKDYFEALNIDEKKKIVDRIKEFGGIIGNERERKTDCFVCANRCVLNTTECSDFIRVCNCGSGQRSDMCNIGSNLCG